MHRSFLKTVSCIQCHHKVFGSKRLKTTPSIHLYSLDIYIWRVLRTYTHSHHKITHSSSLASRRCRSLLLRSAWPSSLVGWLCLLTAQTASGSWPAPPSPPSEQTAAQCSSCTAQGSTGHSHDHGQRSPVIACTVEPVYKGHRGAQLAILYREVVLIHR